MTRRAITCAEQDVASRYWRRHYCYLQRAGVTSKIKRQMRRRERREGKREIR
jgi:hypothetical protein